MAVLRYRGDTDLIRPIHLTLACVCRPVMFTLSFSFFSLLDLSVCLYLYYLFALPLSLSLLLSYRVCPPTHYPGSTCDVLNSPKQAGGSGPRIQDSPERLRQSRHADDHRYIWHLGTVSVLGEAVGVRVEDRVGRY